MIWPPPSAGTGQETDPHAQVRRRLIRLIRQRRREVQFTLERPHDVRFAEVLHPESGWPLVENAAWLLIVDLLEAGVPLEPVALTKPPGATGWVLKITLRGPLYVKMEIYRNKVYLRSFHP